MGKLVKNGVEYCGSSNKAQAIAYDNSTSKLGATTAQGAIDELNTNNTEQDSRLTELEDRIQRISIGSNAYENGSNCYLLLCKIKIHSWSSGILTITSSFWGIQHGSADIITIVAENSSVATGQAFLCRTNLGQKSSNRRYFYYKIVDSYIYIYAYVSGGNQHGEWNVALIARPNMTLYKEGTCTSEIPENVTEVPDAGMYLTKDGTAATSYNVVDYGDSNQIIKIGYATGGLTNDQVTHLAAYAREDSKVIKIKDYSFDNLKTKLGVPTYSYSNGTLTITT